MYFNCFYSSHFYCFFILFFVIFYFVVNTNKNNNISRSPTSPSWHEDDRPLSPVHSVAQAQTQNNPKSSYLESSDISNRSSQVVEQQTSGKQPQFDMHHHHHHPQSIQNNNQTGSIVDTESIVDDCKSVVSQQEERKKDNHFEVPYDIETETKSISSIKSAGSNQELR